MSKRKQVNLQGLHFVRQSYSPRSSVTSDIKSVKEYEEVKEYTIFTLPTEARLSLSTRITVNGQPLRMEVGTGAAFLVSSKNTYQELFSTLPLQHCPVKLKIYSGESLPAFVEVIHDKQQKPLSLLVVVLDGPSLLGRKWLSELRLNWYSTQILICMSWDSQGLQKPSCMLQMMLNLGLSIV